MLHVSWIFFFSKDIADYEWSSGQCQVQRLIAAADPSTSKQNHWLDLGSKWQSKWWRPKAQIYKEWEVTSASSLLHFWVLYFAYIVVKLYDIMDFLCSMLTLRVHPLLTFMTLLFIFPYVIEKKFHRFTVWACVQTCYKVAPFKVTHHLTFR